MKEDNNIAMAVEQINIDQSVFDVAPDTEALLVLPTRNLVLFPFVTITIQLRRELSERVARYAHENHLPVGIVCQKDPDNDNPTLMRGLYRYGVFADILKIIELPNGDKTLLVHARERFKILGKSKHPSPVNGALLARVQELHEFFPHKNEEKSFDTLVKSICASINKILPALDDPIAQMLHNIMLSDDKNMMLNVLMTNFPCSIQDKIRMLEDAYVYDRALEFLKTLKLKQHEFDIRLDIMRKTKVEMDEDQRRAFLHQQMVNIQEELYGDAGSDIAKLEERAKIAHLPQNAADTFNKELVKLRRMNPQTPDYTTLYGYLDILLDVPWFNTTNPVYNFSKAEDELEKEHFGLSKIKERILEQLAVIMYNTEGKSPILCLVGPPGVGKTSLGQSIAKALGREYGRISLGGLHDESEIRGHRRTYIGAMPGRIIDAMRRCKVTNPVLVLDEIDKIGNDYKGDPSAALLEVLDPEQNCKFHDNYIDIDYDLSNVFFIATANTLSTIPKPLLDRMEIIELSGYIVEEKLEIAKRHLIRRICDDLDLPHDRISISDEALRQIIEKYTAESGVRQLDKAIAKICRKRIMAIMKQTDFPDVVMPEHLNELLGVPPYNGFKCESNEYAGLVNGLAWTQSGGEVLLVESSLSVGKGDKLTLTGNLGDVMKESATIALQWVKAHAQMIGIDATLFDRYNLHLHFPEGAIPKDGPSAGITIATSIVSSFRQKRVRAGLAMTGEITLRGKVMPVGGIKEKILAAKRAGITDIIVSADNRKDVEDIEKKYLEGVNFHYVDDALEVIKLAITEDDVKDALKL